jgi:protein-disulfide isomerase
MKKELKIIIGLLLAVIVGFTAAFVIYKNSLPPPQKPTPTVSLPEKYVRPDSAAKGPLDASTTLIEFLDPECEACAAFYPSVKEMLKDYEGRIRFVVRYMPYHKSSMMAIAATEAAGVQGKYWEMQEFLFLNPQLWSHRPAADPEIFKGFAAQLGLDIVKFAADLKNPAWAQKAQRDMADGMDLEVGGTPSFFVNTTPVQDLSISAIRNLLDQSLKLAEQK